MPNPPTTVLGHDLLPAQASFVAADDRFVAFIGGVGSGKTYAGAIKALTYALDHPRSLGLIGAPNKTVLRDSTYRAFQDILPDGVIKQEWKGESRLLFHNGSEILIRSMHDFENRRGANLAWFWLDEGILCGYEAWRVMKARLRQLGYPHQAWLTSTPKGQDHFYHDFEQFPQPRHRLFRAATRDNTYLPEDYAESLGYTGNFALQELEGQFVARDGLVYQVGPATVAPAPPLEEMEEVWGGIDWGYRNPFHLSVFGRKGATIHQLTEYRAIGADPAAAAIPAILAKTQEYGVTTWYAGTDRPEHRDLANERLAADHIASRVKFAKTAVLSGVDTVRSLLESRPPRLFIDPGCVHTLTELAEYHYPDPNERPNAPLDENPAKANDHALDALRYALHSHLGAHRHRADRYLATLRDRLAATTTTQPTGP